MENASGIMTAADAAWQQASAFAVDYSLAILGAIIIIIAGFIVAGMAERWAQRALAHHRGFDETLRRFFARVARYAVLILVTVIVLGQFGVQTASIIATLGAGALAIGLALQGTLQNVAAGIMLLVLKPFRAGEYVDTGSVSGTIEEIGLFATELQRYDGIYILAPNSTLWNAPVTNYSRNHERRNDIVIGIAYDDSIDLAQKTLLELAGGDGRVLREPAPTTFVSQLRESSVAVTLRYWTKTADWWQTNLDLTKAGKEAFDKQGITIPFPQRDVHYIPAEAAKHVSAPGKRARARS